MFPNRRSAVISITVVLVLLVFAFFAIDQNNVSRLKKYRREANTYLDKGMDAMDERFMYSRTLIDLLGDESLSEPFRSVLASYAKDLSPSTLSSLYIALDKELAQLQKKVFTHDQYLLYAAYFEKIYEAELEMGPHLDTYNDKALFYNMQIQGALASFAAKRLEMEALELFSVAPAMKGRP